MNVPMPPPSAGPAGSDDVGPGARRPGVPPWVLPAGLGAVAALVLVLIVVVLTRGDDESVAPATSATVDSISVTTSSTTAPADLPPASAAPATVPATAAPSGSAVATTVAESTPATVAPGPVGTGEALITSDGVTSRYTIVVSCTDFWAGVETTSHVLVDDATGGVWVADVYEAEEGGQRGFAAVDMDAAIAEVLYGLDTPGASPTYVGGLDDSIPGITRTIASLTSGDGPVTIDVEIGEPPVSDDCSTGSMESPSPFTLDEQIVWQPSDDTVGLRFNVLAECGGELLLSGGALLVSTYPANGDTMIALLANAFVLTGEDVVLSNYVTPERNETAFEQRSGGDVRAAIQVFRDGDRTSTPIYLQWTERPPRSAVGDEGLLEEVCPSP